MSICPECLKNIPANIIERSGKILLKKHCVVHGDFEDIYWSDSVLYKKYKGFAHDSEHTPDSGIKKASICPSGCGLCDEHKTAPLLVNLDLTNRCNQKCPVCFANSQASGYLFEPSFLEVKKMMETLRNHKPFPCEAIQFSGGEPTLYPDIIKVIKLARKMGFAQIQIATNGVKASQDLNFCKEMAKAGLDTIYFQFDGVRPETYKQTRGYNAFPVKLRAIENFRKAGLNSIILVPTIIKGVNDDQVGDIIAFAEKNIDIVRGVNFQPVSFSGRIDKDKLKKERITIPDILNLIEKQTKRQILKEDFYPIPSVIPLSNFTEIWKKNHQEKATTHSLCGTGTYVFYKNKKLIPINRYIDVDKFLDFIKKVTPDLSNGKNEKMNRETVLIKFTKKLPSLIKKGLYYEGLKIMNEIIEIIQSGSSPALKKFNQDTLFVGTMHFMDPYNYDIERVKRCGVHYITPNMKIIPFCTYNIFYREKIEKMFSRPIKS